MMLFPADGNGPYRMLRGACAGLVERFMQGLNQPELVQEQRFRSIVDGGLQTDFGREHGFERISSRAEYREAVPVRTHAELLPWLNRVADGEPNILTASAPKMLLETSGTTGVPKHLPVTAPWARTVSEAQSLWMLGLVRDHEALAKGRALSFVSSTRHATSPGGLPIGSNTGRMYQAQPWWLRWRYPVPYLAYTLAEPSQKLYAILRFALQEDISSLTTANPSTLLLMARRLEEWKEPLERDLLDGTLRHGPARDLDRWTRFRLEQGLRRSTLHSIRPADIWNLVLLNCWKSGPAAYFIDRLPEAMGAPVPVREVGITASEGYFAIPLDPTHDGGVLWTLGHLLEFREPEGPCRWAWELEEGETVELVISTSAGLYRYALGDLLEVIGRVGRTPVVRFVGKSGRFLNALGERVTEAQVVSAMARAVETTGVAPIGFCIRIALADVPCYEVWVESSSQNSVPVLQSLGSAFDLALMEENVEYQGRRSSGRLAGPTMMVLSSGTLWRYRTERLRGGAAMGQVKDPVLALNDEEWSRIWSAHQAGSGGMP